MLIVFGILANIQLNKVSSNKVSTGFDILKSFYQLVTGIGMGIFFGLCGWVFWLIQYKFKYFKYTKGIWVFIVVLTFEIVPNIINFPQSKFIGVFIFGYVTHLVWRDDRPKVFLWNLFDKIAVPVVYSHVGGSFNLKAIDGGVIGIAFGIFILGEFVWFFAICCVSFLRCYWVKEALFVGLCWIPKGMITPVLTISFS